MLVLALPCPYFPAHRPTVAVISQSGHFSSWSTYLAIDLKSLGTCSPGCSRAGCPDVVWLANAGKMSPKHLQLSTLGFLHQRQTCSTRLRRLFQKQAILKKIIFFQKKILTQSELIGIIDSNTLSFVF